MEKLLTQSCESKWSIIKHDVSKSVGTRAKVDNLEQREIFEVDI
jgi:hypothetical protein